MIHAEVSCDNDDYGPAIPFDATGWFSTAGDSDILALRGEEYGCGYESDSVAEYMADRDKLVGEFFSYLSFRQTYGRGNAGYTVRISADDAEHWIAENRPHLVAAISE